MMKSLSVKKNKLIKFLIPTVFFVTFFVLPNSVFGATIYVSNTASNSYSIGNDSNTYVQSQNKATPKLTLTGAEAVVLNGDTIILNDGIYNEASYVMFNVPNITVNAENDYLAIIQNGAVAGARVIHQNNLGSNLTIGKITLDGNNDDTSCYTSDSVTNVNGLTINGTKCLNPTTGFIQGGARLYNLTMSGGWIFSQSSGILARVVDIDPPVAGNITISDGTITSETSANTYYAIDVRPSVSGINLDISNVTFSLVGDGVHGTHCIYGKGNSIVNIYNNTCNITNSVSPSAIQIHNHDTIAATDCNIHNNTGILNMSTGGYLILAGDDGTPTTANTISGIDIYNNNFTGANHGYIIGHVTGGKVYNNIGTDVTIGVIGKETTSSEFYNNIINNVVSNSGGLRTKGATNDVFYNNTVYIPAGSVGRTILINTNDGTSTNSTGVIFKNNIAVTADTQPIVDVDPNNIATLANNLYYSAAGLTSNSWLHGDDIFSTLSAWQTAHEATAKYSDPLFSSSSPTSASDFTLTYLSPAIDAGTPVGLTTDYAGNPIYGTPDIGAYEYQPPYTVGTHNIPTTGDIRIYSNGKYRMKTASTTPTTSTFTITPAGGTYQATTTQYMDLTINTWDTTGDQNKQWTATSTAGSFLTLATTTAYTVGDLLPDTYYQFKLDGTASTTAVTGATCNSNGACQSDSSGNLTFNYIGGYSTHTFALERDTTAPNSFSLASDNNTSTTSINPSLSWNPSSDPSSNIAKYQLYVNGTLDTDNIASTTTSVFTGTLILAPEQTPRLQTVYPDGTIVYYEEPKDTKTEEQTNTKTEEQKNIETKNQNQHTFTTNLHKGLTNSEVTQLQQKLRELGFFTYPTNTGYYGTVTEEAVKAFQQAHNIETLGMVGPQTREALNGTKTEEQKNIETEKQKNEETENTTTTFTQTLKKGNNNETIKQLQQKLRTLGFFSYLTNTGYYGTVTEQSVKDFQCVQNIVCTGTPTETGWGVVGPKTRQILNQN